MRHRLIAGIVNMPAGAAAGTAALHQSIVLSGPPRQDRRDGQFGCADCNHTVRCTAEHYCGYRMRNRDRTPRQCTAASARRIEDSDAALQSWLLHCTSRLQAFLQVRTL